MCWQDNSIDNFELSVGLTRVPGLHGTRSSDYAHERRRFYINRQNVFFRRSKVPDQRNEDANGFGGYVPGSSVGL